MNGGGWFHLLPDASANARPLDELWWAMVGLCALVAVGVFVVMFVFCIRYRKGRPADRHLAKETLPVELTWTAVPFLIFMGVFVWSLTLYAHSRTPPANAETIYVVAKQWMWKVQHPGGQREIDTLHVPTGVPIRLMMTSQDVIHSFFVPAFRVKQDVLPDRYTQLWFTATKAGDYPLYCAQYCGLDHSKMGGQVIVMPPRAYARWLDENNTGTSLAARGAALFRAKGCSGCHGANASVHAPDLDGIYGRIVHLADGGTVSADDPYIHDSIMLPDKQIVAGYAPIMPSFSGELSEGDVLALIAYLKSTRPGRVPAHESTRQSARQDTKP
jgi:cytochrome c oxidase subunit 2